MPRAPAIGRFTLDARVKAGDHSYEILGINHRRPAIPGLVLYNRWYGDRTLSGAPALAPKDRERDPDSQPVGAAADTTRPRPAPTPAMLRADSARAAGHAAARNALDLPLILVEMRGDTLVYRAAARRAQRGGGTPIPPNGAVLSATGAGASAYLARVASEGTPVRVVARLRGDAAAPYALVGGWPRVLQDGVNVGIKSDSLEGTFPRFSSARHPRSAVAMTRDSSALLLVVVDGRRAWSVGMSLGELAEALASVGAYQAMNLDGGGSSALWINGEVVNFPSDPTGERAVGNALVVIDGPAPRRLPAARVPR
ncbi:MAG: phosphodiester glycosidase family protein [Gemmatimonadaceae bacterium]